MQCLQNFIQYTFKIFQGLLFTILNFFYKIYNKPLNLKITGSLLEKWHGMTIYVGKSKWFFL